MYAAVVLTMFCVKSLLYFNKTIALPSSTCGGITVSSSLGFIHSTETFGKSNSGTILFKSRMVFSHIDSILLETASRCPFFINEEIKNQKSIQISFILLHLDITYITTNVGIPHLPLIVNNCFTSSFSIAIIKFAYTIHLVTPESKN